MYRIIGLIITLLFVLQEPVAAFYLPQKGFLYLTEINGWQVQIDDSLYNVSDSVVIELPGGEHTLKIAPVNIKNWYFTVQAYPITVYEGDTLKINIADLTYQFLQQQKFATRHIPEIKTDIYPKSQTSFFRRVVQPSLIVTAIAANWASFLTKRKADEFYLKYQQTSDLGEMNYYYDKTAEYDRYAAVLLSVSAAALSTYLFWLLIE